MKIKQQKRKQQKLNLMVNDTLSDMLTRIRNAQLAKHSSVSVFNTKLNKKIIEILYNEGYIKQYGINAVFNQSTSVKENEQKDHVNSAREIEITLKYLTRAKIPCISKIQRVSSPGLRFYAKSKDIPKPLNGMATVILTTSHGILTDKQARRKKIGGEILCSVC